MKRKSALALLAMIVGGGILFSPQEAHAVFHGVIVQLAELAFEGLDFVQTVLFGVLTRIFTALLLSSAALFSSARLLDWAVEIPINLQNDLVTAGFKFTSGLVNLVIVVVFVLIAFSAILKFDAFGAKKALPKLILVALLVNFSMLIVGFFVDIAQVLFNTIQNTVQTVPGESIADSAIKILRGGITNVLDEIGEFFGLWLGAYLAPPLLPATVAWLGWQIYNDLNGGDLLQAIFLIAINTILAATFFLYALLFVARVAVIWLLAIAAPLALAAWAFPVKNNYFGDWFKQLLSWSFLGIVAFFLMGIGMKLFSVILGVHSPPVGSIGLGTLELSSGFYAYIFLAVYLFVAFQVSKKFAPQAAAALIEQGKALVMPQLKAVGSRLGSAAWKRFGQKFVEGKGKGVRESGEKLTDWGKQKKGPLGVMARTAGWGAKRMGKRIEVGAGRLSRVVASQNQQEVTAAENEAYIYAADARDKINEELQKGSAANWNRIIGLTKAMIQHNDADDLQNYIRDGSLDGKAIGKALLFGNERLGPAGYRTMIKGLGGMIYTEPEKLGWNVHTSEEALKKDLQANDPKLGEAAWEKLKEAKGWHTDKDTGKFVDSYGSPVLRGRFAKETDFLENTVKREIIEKLTTEEITTMSILGDYIKKADDPDWSAGHDALVTRIIRERGGALLGATTRRGETRAARRHTGELINKELNTHFGTDMDQNQSIQQFADAHPEFLDSFASVIKFAGSPGAATAGIPINYQVRAGDRNAQNEIRDVLGKRASPLRAPDVILTEINAANARLGTLAGPEREELVGVIRGLVNERNELSMLQDITQIRYIASQATANPRPLNEVEIEVRREYEQKYRTPLLRQVRNEGPFIQWNADVNFRGNYRQASSSRIRELYDRLRLQDITPPLSPSPSPKERKLFEGIARGEAPVPPAQARQRERKLAGSLGESLQWVQTIEARVTGYSQTIQQKTERRENASGEIEMRDRWQAQLKTAKDKMGEIRRELNLT